MPQFQQEQSLSQASQRRPNVKYPGADAIPEDKARWTVQRYETQNNVYLPFENQWTQNIAFLRSRHWDQWDPYSFSLRPEKKVPAWRERLVDNYVWAIWKTIVSKLTKNRPAWETRAASMDPQDVNASIFGRSILENMWTQGKRVSRLWRRTVSWVGSTGNAWIEVWWNPEIGGTKELSVEWPLMDPQTGEIQMIKVAVHPQTGEPLVDQMGFPLSDPRTGLPYEPIVVPRGDVDFTLHSPYAVRVNPEGFSDPDAVTDAVVATIVSREQFERRYGEKMADDIHWGGENALEKNINALESISTGGAREAGTQVLNATTRDAKVQTTVLFKHLQKPSSEYPEGRMWVAAPPGVLVEPEQSLPLGVWPLIHIPAYENPGLLLSQAPIEPIIPLNRRLNQQNSRIAEHEKLMMRGKWLVPKGAGLSANSITSAPGEVIEHMPGFPPVQANIKALPAAVYNEREVTKADIQFVSGVHKISLGQPPPGVTAGKAFLVLQEADDTDLGPILASLADALAEMGTLALWFVRWMYEEPRAVAVSGMEAGEYLYRDFTGDMLDPGNIGDLAFTVKVQEGSMFPWSKAAAQEVALQVIGTPVGQALLINEQGVVNKQVLRSLLQVGGLENLIPSSDPDVSEAERIYHRIATRLEPPQGLMPWFNLPVHIEVFERKFKSISFEAEDPMAQNMALQWYQLMREALAEQTAQAQAAMIQQQAEAEATMTYANEKARLQAEVEIMGNPERTTPGGKKTLAARERSGDRVTAEDVSK